MSNVNKAAEIIKEIVNSLPGISGGRLCSQAIIKIKERNIGVESSDLVGILGSLVEDGSLTLVDYRLHDAKQISHKLFFPKHTTITVISHKLFFPKHTTITVIGRTD